MLVGLMYWINLQNITNQKHYKKMIEREKLYVDEEHNLGVMPLCRMHGCPSNRTRMFTLIII